MKYLLLVIVLLLSSAARAQFLTAELGINGLTCSQCSNSVAIQLQKLPFVSAVEMDLEETIAHVTFKKNAKVNWNEIPQAIINAGFSIRNAAATFNSEGATTWEERNFKLNGTCFTSAYPLEKGIMKLRFIGPVLNAKDSQWSGQADFTTSCISKDAFAVIQTNAKTHD